MTKHTAKETTRYKSTMHIFGENVIDFEGVISSELTGGASLTTEHLTMPVDTGFHIVETINSEIHHYYCKPLFDKEKMTANNQSIRMAVNQKYDLDGVIQSLSDVRLEDWKIEKKINNFIDITLIEKSGGGGAHNSAYCAQVYLNSSTRAPLEVRLVVPHTSSDIATSLPKGLDYEPIIKKDNNSVKSNLNFRGPLGEKINFRGRQCDMLEYKIDADKIKNNDIIVIDSIKDPAYINAVVNVLDSKKNVDFYLAATDSMINKLTREYVYKLALKSDLLVCNNSEFNLLVGKTIHTDEDLAYSLILFQNDRKNRYGKTMTIAVTFGEIGSVICDAESNIYFQQTAVARRTSPLSIQTEPVKNTNGCGDAYFAMMALGHALDHDTRKKLDYSNAAGHLCALKPKATDSALFTNADIGNYRRDYGDAPILTYDIKTKRFA
jgi:fructose-1-phosphate kinase PfkB-like protein